MRKRLKAFLFLFLVVLSVLASSGCWDALSLDDRDICTTVIVDKENGIYSFCVEIIQPEGASSGEQGAGTGTKKTVIVKGSGPSLVAARNDLDNKLNKPIFLGAVQSLLITRRMAEDSIEEYVYRVRDISEYRKTMHVNVISKSPEEFLGMTPENSENIGFAIERTLQDDKNLGQITEVRLEDILQKMYSSNTCYILNDLDENGGQVFVSGVSVFHGGKNIGCIPLEKCRGINYIEANMADKPRENYVVPAGNGQVTVEAVCTDRNIKSDYKDGNVIFTLDMDFDGLEMYPSTSEPLTREDKKEIKQKLEDMIKAELESTLKEAQQEFGCDYLGLNEYFRTAYPDIYDNMNWDEEFQKAQFLINTNVNVKMEDKTLDYGVKRESK